MDAHATGARATASSRRPIGEFLVERGLVTPAELEAALDQQRVNGKRLGEILVERGSITRMALASVLGEQWEEAGRHLRAVVPVRLADGKEADTGLAGGEELTESLASLQSAVARLEELAGEAGEAPRAAGSEPPSAEIAAALEQLQAELAEVKVVLAQPLAADESLAERLGRIEDALSAQPDDNLGERLGRIEAALAEQPAADERVDELLAAVERGSRLDGSLLGAIDELRATVERTAAPEGELLSRLERLESALADRSLAEQLAELRGALDELSTPDRQVRKRLDRIEHALQERDPAEALTGALARLQDGLERLPRDADLLARLDRIDGAVAERTGLDEGRFDALQARLGGVEAGLATLAELEHERGSRAAAEVVEEVRNGLDTLRAGLGPVADLHGAMERLAAELRDELRSLPSGDEQAGRVLAGVDEVRARLDELRPDDELLERLARIEAALSATGQHRDDASQQAAAALDGLRDRVEAQSAGLLGAFHELRERLDRPAPEVELSEQLGRIEGALAQREGLRPDDELHERLGRIETAIAAQPHGEAGQLLEELRSRLAGLEGSLWALAERRDGGASTEVEELRVELRGMQPGGDHLADVLAGLDEVRQRLDGLGPDDELGERLGGIEAVAAALREEVRRGLDELRADLGSKPAGFDEAELASRVAGTLAERLEGLEMTLGELSAYQPAPADPGAIAAHVVSELSPSVDAALDGLRMDLAGLMPAASADEVAGRVANSLHGRFEQLEAAVADRVREATPDAEELVRRVGEDLAGRLDGLEGAVRDRPELERIDELRERLDHVCERLSGDRDTELLTQLGRIEAELGAAGASAHEELAGTVGRLDEELARRLEELLARVGGVEQAVRESAPYESLERQARRTDELGEALRGLETVLTQHVESGHTARLEAIAERLDSVDYSLSALSQTAVEPALAPTEPEPEPTSYLAMLSSAEGYRLVGVEGRLPPPGMTLNLPEAGRPLVVARHGRSPLPGDRRRCVYLEAV